MDFLSQNKEIFLFLALFFSIVSLIATIILLFKILNWQKKIKVLLTGKTGKDLEGLLNDIFKDTKANKKEIKEIKEIIKHLTNLTEKSIQKVGIVRFNPFKDTGGDLSFSLALLDYYNNGVIISSLHGREETRIYAKPIINGQSKYNLSTEEEKALKQAISKNNKKAK